MITDPYLSVAMGIGGVLTEDLLDRLETSIWTNVALANTYLLPVEFIICEWNGRLPEMEWPNVGICRIRILHTGKLHSQVHNPDGLRYFEWYPKNIAIRRAVCPWVLSTNPDDIWSGSFARFLSERKLEPGKFYRINRHDMIDGKVYRICYQTGCFAPDVPLEFVQKNPLPGATPWGGPHMNAAGDFMLMEKESWFKIRGNPEKSYNHTVDGETVAVALQSGLVQEVLPFPLYHPEHERTLNYNETGQFVGPLDWSDANPCATQNGEGWGFRLRQFKETVIG